MKMDLCTTEHPQNNGIVEKRMSNLVKVMHAGVTEGKDPAELLLSFLREYRAIPNVSTKWCRQSSYLDALSRLDCLLLLTLSGKRI